MKNSSSIESVTHVTDTGITTKLQKLCKHHFSNIVEEIHTSLEYNHGISFDTGCFGERMMFILCNTVGIPSNGGCAFDSLLKAESKAANYAQTYECLDCKSKNNYYSPNCWNCGSTNYKLKADTRFGINATAHFKYLDEIPFYIMTTITPLNRDVNNPKFKVETYRFYTKDEFFCDLLRRQLTAGSTAHKNFMPYGRDFMMSSPTLLMSATVDCSSDNVETVVEFLGEKEFTQMPTTLLTMKECEKLGFKYKADRKNKLTPTMVRAGSGDMVDIAVACELIGVKKSTHGKPRGILNRNDKLQS